MTKYLGAAALGFLLAGAACSETWKTFTSKQGHFQVQTCGKLVPVKEKEGHMFCASHPDGEGEEGVVLLHKHLTRYQAFELLQKISGGAAKQVTERREILVGGKPGLELIGLNGQGRPIHVRIVDTGVRTYMVMATGMDTAHLRTFVESFRWLP